MAFKDPQRPACDEVGPLLSELRAGELPPAIAERLTAHLEDCEACRAEAEAIGEIEASLRFEAAPEPGPAFAERVVGNLPQRRSRRARLVRPLSLAGAGLAAAAAVLLLFGLPSDPPEELQDSVMVREVVPESWVGLLQDMEGEALDAVVEALQTEVNEAETESFRGGMSEAGAWAEVAALAAEDPEAIVNAAASNDQGGE